MGYISLGYFKQKVKAARWVVDMPHKSIPIDFEIRKAPWTGQRVLRHLAVKLPVSRGTRPDGFDSVTHLGRSVRVFADRYEFACADCETESPRADSCHLDARGKLAEPVPR